VGFAICFLKGVRSAFYVITLSGESAHNHPEPAAEYSSKFCGMHLKSLLQHGAGGLFRVTSMAVDAVIPGRCAFCGCRRLGAAGEICEGCFEDLPWVENSCPRCAQPVLTALPANVHCADCQIRPPPFTAAVAPLLYSFPVDAAIKAMKFRRKLFFVPAFAALLEQAYGGLPPDIDAVLPVPLHWHRHATRGFNQAAELSHSLQRKYTLTPIRNVTRKRSTQHQSGLAANQRRRNLRFAFAVRGKIQARHVLIVDDVITTGETCRQLAKAVLRGGAEKVSVIAIARATTI
jgi:ComF family protein